ncbi:hypothetical protein [Novosphingobium sp.]|uniref:hypothetical protein n=1 Tax=Novosphingobium sp. TaxID=1874826 RepID=UPI00286E2944|nr:hypothetical protein [Novosphingobium sp.]
MPLPGFLARSALPVIAIIAGGMAAPALAASAPTTKVVSCAAGNCLVIWGSRERGSETVLINGHAVSVQGNRNWKVSLPVAQIRDWSQRYARTIEVSTIDAMGVVQTSAEARLPIGLLGGTTNLALLEVRVK